jgi:hypothetical protein
MYIEMTNYSFLLNRYCGVGTNQKEAQWFKEINAAITHWAGAFIVADYIPYLKWVTKLQGITTSLQRLQIQISSFIPKIIDEHRNAPLTTKLKTLWMCLLLHVEKMGLGTFLMKQFKILLW